MLTHTFVIPAYKESPYLELCIQSLLSQSIESEIIITTSTPTAYTEQIAQKHEFAYHINPGKGIASDWNFALSKAKTMFATIAHQDDIYEPEYAEKLIAAMSRTDNTLIGFTDYLDLVNDRIRPKTPNWFVKKALLLPFALTSTVSSKFLKKAILAFGDPICCPSVTLNLAQLKKFSFSGDFTCALDWYAWYQLAFKDGAFCFVNQKLVKHRIHPESETTFQLSQGIRRQEELRMFKLIWGDRMASFISWVYALGHNDNNLMANHKK